MIRDSAIRRLLNINSIKTIFQIKTNFMFLILTALKKSRDIKISLGKNSIIAKNSTEIIGSIDKLIKNAKLNISSINFKASCEKEASLISCHLVYLTKKILEL